MDTRISKLAYTLVHYSTRIEKGEKVLISYNGASCKPLIKEIIRHPADEFVRVLIDSAREQEELWKEVL